MMPVATFVASCMARKSNRKTATSRAGKHKSELRHVAQETQTTKRKQNVAYHVDDKSRPFTHHPARRPVQSFNLSFKSDSSKLHSCTPLYLFALIASCVRGYEKCTLAGDRSRQLPDPSVKHAHPWGRAGPNESPTSFRSAHCARPRLPQLFRPRLEKGLALKLRLRRELAGQRVVGHLPQQSHDWRQLRHPLGCLRLASRLLRALQAPGRPNQHSS